MNLLVTGAFNWKKEELDTIRSLGNDVEFLQYERNPLPCNAMWVEGIIGNGIFLSHSIENFANLKYIQLTSAGYDRVPMDYVIQNGIQIYNAKGVYSIPMAEFAVCGVLELYKHSRFFFENQKEHKWEKHRGIQELFGKTVCIVGCGSVGTECAKRFAAMGCRTLGVDMYPDPSAEYYEAVKPFNCLNEVLQKSDVVVLTVPLTEETYHMMDAGRIGNMKENSILVNIARGAVVDTQALTEALNGKLGGAVLDVFEEEPLLEESPLWKMGNVVMTPHNSFVGEGNHERMWKLILENLRGA